MLPGNPPDDGEPLVREGSGLSPDEKVTAAQGRLYADVHSFERKPYSLRYRVRLEYLPGEQTDAIRLQVGDLPFSRRAETRVGSDATFAAELTERVGEIGRDLMALERLAREFREGITRSGWPGKGWPGWRDQAHAGVREIQERNHRRFSIWAVWPEYQARMRIDGLTDYLEKTLGLIEGGGDSAGATSRLESFLGALDEAYTAIGIDAPLDPITTSPALAAYERAAAPLRLGMFSPEVRSDALRALFDLLPLLRSRFRIYPYLNAISDRLARIFELARGGAPEREVRAAVERHQAAVGDFKRVAGLGPPGLPRPGDDH